MEKALDTPLIKAEEDHIVWWLVLYSSTKGVYRCLERLAVMLGWQHDAMGKEILKNSALFVLAMLINVILILIHLNLLFQNRLQTQKTKWLYHKRIVRAEKYPTSCISRLCASIAQHQEVFFFRCI